MGHPTKRPQPHQAEIGLARRAEQPSPPLGADLSEGEPAGRAQRFDAPRGSGGAKQRAYFFEGRQELLPRRMQALTLGVVMPEVDREGAVGMVDLERPRTPQHPQTLLDELERSGTASP